MTHWVFAYGSNMDVDDLGRWQRERGLEVRAPLRVEPAAMSGYELVWDYFSKARDGAAANVQPAAGELLGAAILVDEALLAAIDRKEGHPARYHRGDSPQPARLLQSGEVVQAWLYRVLPPYRHGHRIAPRRAYMEIMIRAANELRLDPEYIAALEAIETSG